MNINVEIDRISIKPDVGEEMWLTLGAARCLQRRLNVILGSVGEKNSLAADSGKEMRIPLNYGREKS